MPHKKKSDEPASEEQELINRVDAMMDLKRTEVSVSAPSVADQPIDIFKDMQTKPPIIIEPAETAEISPVENPEPIAVPDPTIEGSPPQLEAPSPELENLPKAALNDTTDQDSYDDEKTDQAVDDIVLAESDELLAVEDIVTKTAPPLPSKHKSLLGKLFQ